MFPHFTSQLSSLNLPLRIQISDAPAIDLGTEPKVTLRILDPDLLNAGMRPSLDKLAEAYVEKRIELYGPIMQVIEIADRISAALSDDAAVASVAQGRHAREEDAEAISYHYDLSNDFFRLWLDPEMVYSCAYFETGTENLATAQVAKMRHICRKLRLQRGDYLLDVGCGWGGLARLAAREFGAKVFGITLSQQQLKLARERVKSEKLKEHIQLELMDYRDLPRDGRFDKIVSVGMFEHVGHANMSLYFQHLHDAVRPGGLVMNHGITAKYTDQRQLEIGRGGGNFIKRYVFPYGEIPHLATAIATMSDAGLEVVDVESLRLHYARTLEFWSNGLEKHMGQAMQLVPEKSLRIWRLYLAGCAYAFQRGWVNLHQILAVKPLEDGTHGLPWSRRDIYELS